MLNESMANAKSENKELLKSLKKILSLTKRIGDLEAEKARLEKIAYTDTLTGFSNRTYYEEWIAKNNNMSIYPITVISADCNGLKRINDTYGHSVGDEYIKATANVLRDFLPEKAIIARTGGDEFTCIIPNTSLEETTEYISLLRMICRQETLENGEFVSISFGSAYSENYIPDIKTLFNKADKEMYAEKAKAKAKRYITMVMGS